MPDEAKEVKYSYTGDVSGLRQATEDAIGLLDKYQQRLLKVSQGFSPKGQKYQVAASMHKDLQTMSDAVKNVRKQLSHIGDYTSPASKEFAQNLQQAMKSVEAGFEMISKGSRPKRETLEQAKTATSKGIQQMPTSTPELEKQLAIGRQVETIHNVLTKGLKSLKTESAGLMSLGNFVQPYVAKIKQAVLANTALGRAMQSMRDKAAKVFLNISTLSSAVASAFRRVKTETESADDSVKKTANNIKKSTNKIVESLNKLTPSAHAVNSAFKFLKRNVGVLAAIPLSTWLARGIKSAINYTEVLNKFNVAMGNSVDVANEFIDRMSLIYGMDPANLMDTAGTFYLLSDAIRMPEEASTRMALNLTKAANDVASLYNVEIARVSDNFQSGMMGMSRAVKQYGFDITQASLEQTALQFGIKESIQTMSEANKRALRYITLMQQMSASTQQIGTDASGASVIMGDFANTIEQPANQLRIFKEQMIQLGRAIGNFFVKPLSIAMAYVNGFIMALRQIISFIGSLLGIVGVVSSSGTKAGDDITEATDNISSGLGGVASGAQDAADELKKMIAPFDELNLLQAPETPDIGGGGGGGLGEFDDIMDPKLLEWIENFELKLENIKMKAREVAEAILTWSGFELDADGQILSWSFDSFLNSLQETFNLSDTTVEQIKGIFKGLGDLIQVVYTDAIVPAVKGIGEVLKTVWESFISPVLKTFGEYLAEVFGDPATIETFKELFKSLGDLISAVWNNIIKPAIEGVGQVLVSLLSNVVLPFFDQTRQLFASILMDVLIPFITWLINDLGPTVSNVIQTIADIIGWLSDIVGGIIQNIIGFFQGLVDFIAGILTLDIDRAFMGIAEMVGNIFAGIMNVITAIVNSIISLVNLAIAFVWDGLRGLVNFVLGIVNSIGGLFGASWNLSIGAEPPQIGYLPAMATGGVVTGPTVAMIGEGRYDEAVIPLGNSPQMEQFARNVADKSYGEDQVRLLQEQNELLRQILDKTGVSLDGKKLTDAVTKRQRQNARALGGL